MPKNVVLASSARQTSHEHAGLTYRTFVDAKPRLTFVQYFFEAGMEVPPHSHGDEEQGVYCVSGRFAESLGGEDFEFGPGDGFYIPPGAAHGIRCIEKGSYLMCTSKVPKDK